MFINGTWPQLVLWLTRVLNFSHSFVDFRGLLSSISEKMVLTGSNRHRITTIAAVWAKHYMPPASLPSLYNCMHSQNVHCNISLLRLNISLLILLQDMFTSLSTSPHDQYICECWWQAGYGYCLDWLSAHHMPVIIIMVLHDSQRAATEHHQCISVVPIHKCANAFMNASMCQHASPNLS